MFTQYNKWKQTIQCFGGNWEEGESGYCSDLWEERIGIADWNVLNVLVWRKEDVGVLWKCLCTFSVQGTDKCKWKTLPATGHAMTVSIKGIEEGQREEVINGKSKRSVKNLSWSKDLLHFIPTSPAGQSWSLWKWTTGNEGVEPSPQDIKTYSSNINAWWRPQGELDEEATAQLEQPHDCAKWRTSEKFSFFKSLVLYQQLGEVVMGLCR